MVSEASRDSDDLPALQVTLLEQAQTTKKGGEMRGDGRIFLRGKTYWCAYFTAGEEQRESCQTSDEKKAEKYLRSIIKRIHASEIQPEVPFLTHRDRKRTISDLMDAYKTHLESEGKGSPQNLSTIKRVKEDFGSVLAYRLTKEQITAWIASRRAEQLADGTPKYQSATINRILQSLRAAFNYAELPAPRFDLISEDGNTRTGFFSEQELAKIKAALPADLADFFAWCAATGMRKGETASLRWEWVDSDRLTVPGKFCKNRKPHSIPLTGELAAIVRRRRERRTLKDGTLSALLFHRKGKPIQDFRKAWAKARKVASCPGRLFHDLRRTAARNLRRSGVDETVAMTITGHKTASMFRRYSITDDQDQREAFARVEAMRKAQLEAYLAEQAKQAQTQAVIIPVAVPGQNPDNRASKGLFQMKGIVGSA